MDIHNRIADVLFGSIVALIAVPTGFGPAVGGWVAGRRTDSAAGGALAGGLAGLLGVFPWAALVYLAAAGAIDPIGYHEGIVHVGVNPAAPGTLVLWQEVGVAALLAGVVVSVAVAGGLLAGARVDVVSELREEAGNVREELGNGA